METDLEASHTNDWSQQSNATAPVRCDCVSCAALLLICVGCRRQQS
jgi:hypothetical protein